MASTIGSTVSPRPRQPMPHHPQTTADRIRSRFLPKLCFRRSGSSDPGHRAEATGRAAEAAGDAVEQKEPAAAVVAVEVGYSARRHARRLAPGEPLQRPTPTERGTPRSWQSWVSTTPSYVRAATRSTSLAKS